MQIKIYIDEGAPFIACEENKLSDGSIAHDIYFRGNRGKTSSIMSDPQPQPEPTIETELENLAEYIRIFKMRYEEEE
jgi:hypothetical protein